MSSEEREQAKEEFYKREGLEEIFYYENTGGLFMDEKGTMHYVSGIEIVAELTLAESVQWHSILSIAFRGYSTNNSIHRWYDKIAITILSAE